METQQVDRRSQASPASPALDHDIDKAGIVRQGMLIQACLGTIGAVEFLKAHDVGAAVIHRVLTSQQVRADDL
ncbi:hypothetical protein [Massilia sp. 9096]|uniref:hypothetical protein n=1 Tax=Massilia sp. 9096 TaxID=1500894 RepID=UPI00055FC54C|nr:hypothetical protein [Massilia sp. 9096]